MIFIDNTKGSIMETMGQKEIPILGKWVIRYDDKYQMPQFVQGMIIGDTTHYKNGQAVVINNIESIDLKDQIITTYDGTNYKMIGAGKRMILLNMGDLIELRIQDNRKKLPIPMDEDFEDD